MVAELQDLAQAFLSKGNSADHLLDHLRGQPAGGSLWNNSRNGGAIGHDRRLERIDHGGSYILAQETLADQISLLQAQQSRQILHLRHREYQGVADDECTTGQRHELPE